jgi:hypothetical protein
MKQRFKKIMTGLLLTAFSIVGLWEYMQLYLYFDLPQAIVVLPLFGAVSAIVLKKLSLLTPVFTAVISVVYQIVETRSSSVGIVEVSKIKIILNILPIIIIFMFLGIGGGLLIRVLINGKKSKAAAIPCCVLGIVLSVGSGIFMFHNPLYPFLAKHQVKQYAKQYDTADYPVSEVSIYYSLEDLEYEGRVVMSDGYVYALYHEKSTGSVYEEQQEN